MNKKVFLVVMASMLCSKGLLAEEQPMNFMGNEMVVTATKTLNSISDAGGASVTVITSEEIKASGQNTVEEVLKGVAALDIVSNGGPGSQTSVFIRGGDARDTLVLLDGVSLNNPSTTDRSADLANLTVDNIERIEVVRGPMSSLYGSNASAGVINIITRKGSGPLHGYGGIEGGAYNTYKGYAGVNGQSGPSAYSFSLSRITSDGFSFADTRNPYIPQSGKSEKDGYDSTTFSGSYAYHFSPESVLEMTFRVINAHDQYAAGMAPPFYGYLLTSGPQDHVDDRQYIGRVALKKSGEVLTSTCFVQYTDLKRNDFGTDGAQSDTYAGSTKEAGWQGDLHVTKENTLTFGMSGKNEGMKYTDYLYGSSAIDKSLFSWNTWLQEQWSFSGVKLVAGLRYEDNEMFGNKLTWRVAPSYTIGNTTVKASYGTGFMAPTLYELYSQYGLVTLKPETSKGWDGGVEQRLLKNLRGGITYFSTMYSNLIDFDPNAGPLLSYGGIQYHQGQYVQYEGDSKSQGIESFIEWKPLDELQFTITYTYNKTEDPTGAELVHRPENKAGLIGKYLFGTVASLSANMQWVGERAESSQYFTDGNGNPISTLPSYFLLNLAGSYKLTDKVELYGRIDNVFNTWYEQVWSYATPGRSAYAGVKVTF